MTALLPRLAAALLVAAFAAPSPARADAFPGLRVSGGAVWHVDPDRAPYGALDVLAMAQLYGLDGDELFVNTLLGYGYEGDATHLVQLGAEVGLAPSVHFQAELGARGVLGSSRGELGGGVRLTAGADFVLGIFHVEAAYQALATRGDVEHDLRVMAGVDFFRFLLVPIMLMGMH